MCHHDVLIFISVTCVVGNKCDLQDGRKVEMSAAQDYADSIDSLFFETSALKNTGIYYDSTPM